MFFGGGRKYMAKIEKEIKNNLYMGAFIVVANIISLLLDIIIISELSYIILLIIIIVPGLCFAIKSILISEKIEQKDEFIRYAEEKAD